ncbi:hypothetical protein GXP67_32445 [Rhodocytophaga rosea]|uniref:Uncharacterized protein n=1 Tax=Rhodocytophaga rosea TaxID=2704465 RepID=A0A6C0GSF0_9BACT|nr:hypothetical protein [Rhodocytophaga rosea]QHT71028.1 hypothetical protein GXP67_32445 [Rhodocytophaga rosea]
MKSLLLSSTFILLFSTLSYADYIGEIPNISAREIAMMSAQDQTDVMGKGVYISSEQKHKMNQTTIRKSCKKPASKVK